MIEFLEAPVNKVGLVLLRDANSDDPAICLVQVKAKNPAEQEKIDFGLPKGTRQYRDPESGAMRDARDSLTASRYKDHLESLPEALCKESEEEIGLDPHDVLRGPVKLLGARLFAPRDGSTPYDIQWYVMEADAGTIDRMKPDPLDANEVRWFKKSEVDALAAEGKINPNYPAVIDEAIAKFQNKQLMPALLVPPQRA